MPMAKPEEAKAELMPPREEVAEEALPAEAVLKNRN
jgi:hypothetical protein